MVMVACRISCWGFTYAFHHCRPASHHPLFTLTAVPGWCVVFALLLNCLCRVALLAWSRVKRKSLFKKWAKFLFLTTQIANHKANGNTGRKLPWFLAIYGSCTSPVYCVCFWCVGPADVITDCYFLFLQVCLCEHALWSRVNLQSHCHSYPALLCRLQVFKRLDIQLHTTM